MRTLDDWLTEYAESHRHPLNRIIHKVCVPLILWTIVGFFSLVPAPVATLNTRLGVAPFLCAFTLWFYALLGVRPFFEMLALFGMSLLLCVAASLLVSQPWVLYAAIFVLAWIGQAIGHAVEGKKPSFFRDLQFLLIGPLWILRQHKDAS